MPRIQSHVSQADTPVAGHKPIWKDEDMKSRLITALAIGALAIGMLPGIASAANDNPLEDIATAITVTVGEGTTIIAPADFLISSAHPGQTTVSASKTLTWWSNEYPKVIKAYLSADLKQDLVDPGVDTFIKMYDVSLSINAGTNYTAMADGEDAAAHVTVGTIADVVEATNESASTQAFQLKVFVPQATEGDYAGVVNFAVE